MKVPTVAIAFLLTISSFALHGESVTFAVATIVNTEGDEIGEAIFEQAPTGVLVNILVSDLPPGPHGIHIHAVGACKPDFAAAKAHINVGGKAHGFRHPDGPDNGNLPTLYVHADGTAQAEFFTTLITVDDGSAKALLDKDGSAIVIHKEADDHYTQPIGGSGARIACGEIIALEESVLSE